MDHVEVPTNWHDERAARIRAEDLLRRTGELVALLGHELRNRVGALSNAVAALERGDLDPEQTKLLHAVIGRQTRELASLMDALADLDPGAGGAPGLREVVALDGAMRQGLTRLDALGAVVVPLSLEPVLVGLDPAALDRIIARLLRHAAGTASPGHPAAVLVSAEGDHAVIRVRPGTDRPDQAAAGRSGPGHRAPLDLALARHAVETFGGTLEREPTTGDLVVRLARRSPGNPAPAVLARPGGASLRVLVVEDHEDARTTLRRLLEMCGHEVREAGSAESGYATGLAWRPGVALIDVGLPDLDGHELARRLRATADPGLRLVALTGLAEARDRHRAREAGFDAYLVKPVRLDELDALLRGLTREETPAAPE